MKIDEEKELKSGNVERYSTRDKRESMYVLGEKKRRQLRPRRVQF